VFGDRWLNTGRNDIRLVTVQDHSDIAEEVVALESLLALKVFIFKHVSI